MTPRHAQEKATVKRSIPVTAIRENVPVLALAGIAFGASYGHIVELCGEHGPHGWKQYATAGVVDLLCIIGAEERQRDKRISRPRTAKWPSWSAVVLVIGIALTLFANIATAKQGFLGYFVAALPAGALLLAVSVLERRASFEAPASTKRDRRKVAASTGTAERQETAPVLPAATPEPAPSTAPAKASPEPVPAEQTFEALLADARKYRDELTVAGERLSKDKLRIRFAIGSGKALDVLRALKDEDRNETEAAI